MILSSVLGVLLAALPVWAGLVSFAVPDTIKDGDEITVIVTMNSELGSVWDYNLVLSATERSLPYGYLGGRGFAMIDLRGQYFTSFFLFVMLHPELAWLTPMRGRASIRNQQLHREHQGYRSRCT